MSLPCSEAANREHRWREVLRDTPVWAPPPTPLVVVALRREDATRGVGGLMASWRSLGRPVTVVSVLEPEPRQLHHQTPEDLNQLAKGIDTMALGLSTERAQRDIHRLQHRLGVLLRDEATLHAPYEREEHAIQEAVAQLCLSLSAARGLRLLRYPLHLWRQRDPDAWTQKRTVSKLCRVDLDEASRAAKLRALGIRQRQTPTGSAFPCARWFETLLR